MANEILMAIALPHGLTTAGRGMLSVYLAPRARAGGTLVNTDWEDWPSVVNSLTFTVFIDGNAVPANQTTTVSAPASSAVWAAVFAPGIPWDIWEFTDRRGREYLTLEEHELHSDIVAMYAAVGDAFPTTIPTIADLRRVTAAAELLSAGDARARLARAKQFASRLAGTTGPGGGQGVDTIDFNQALSLLGRHPHLLRVLGIVVDFEVGLPATFGQVAVSTDIDTRPGNTVQEISPQTCVRPDWWPFDGFEPLADERLVQIDVLSAAGRLEEFVRTLPDSDGPAPLPGLEEFGVALVRTDAVALLQSRAEQMAGIERDIRRLIAGQVDVVSLCDTDTVIGHRIDVAASKGPFRSLHQRVCPDGYRFPRDPALKVSPPADENWVSTTLGTEATEVASQQRARPVLHRWTGWSAAAPPPGRILDPVTGAAIDPPPSSPVPGPVQFHAEYLVRSGTLARLRYGTEYTLRARRVDISGASVDVASTGGRPQSPPPIVFGRWAPVPSPAAVRRNLAPVPGVDDTPTQLVVRSELEQDDATVTPTDRLLFPPVGTQQLAERHGVPDDGIQPAAYAELAARDGRSLTDDTSADPLTAERVVVTKPDGEVLPGPEQLEVSYLPDPAGEGVGFTGVPGVRGTLVRAWRGTWPDLATQRLILTAGPEATSVVGADDAVEVRLPKAGWIDVEVACTIPAKFSGHFGVVTPLREARSPDQLAQLERDIADGRIWLVSARKVLTLIHAVRVPLTIPVVSSLNAARQLNGRHARITGALALNRASTRRVTLRGTWTDPVDDPAEEVPRDAGMQAIIGKVSVDREGGPTIAAVDLRWRVDDTRHREVTVTAEAFSRFSRHFTEQDEVTFDTDTVTVDGRGLVPSSVTVTQGEVTFAAETDYVADATGTLTRVAGGAIGAGAAVTVRWIPLPTSRLSDEDSSEQFLLEVPNTQPPPPPKVLEVLPAFKRRRARNPEVNRAEHTGSVVRLWLGRGWFASGAGELLGVVCDPPGTGVATHSVSGRDPVFRSDEPARITSAVLPSASTVMEGVPAADGTTVDVAGHEVTFDPDTGRWHVDVVIDDRSFRPFVRLVLCRLQPHSVEGAHLSSLVVTDPLRLGPTRTSVARVTDAGATISVSVAGRGHLGVPDPNVAGVSHQDSVIAWIEERDATVDDPDLGWAAIDGPVALQHVRRGGLDVWSHDSAVPAGGFADDAQIRVRLEEREPLLTGPATDAAIGFSPAFVETLPVPLAAFARRVTSQAL